MSPSYPKIDKMSRGYYSGLNIFTDETWYILCTFSKYPLLLLFAAFSNQIFLHAYGIYGNTTPYVHVPLCATNHLWT
jgi:hypothetical protein